MSEEKSVPLVPIAKELLVALTSSADGLDPAAFAACEQALRAIKDPRELVITVQDCMRAAYWFEHMHGRRDVAKEIEHAVGRALAANNENHGRVNNASERTAKRARKYQKLTDQDAGLNAPRVGVKAERTGLSLKQLAPTIIR